MILLDSALALARNRRGCPLCAGELPSSPQSVTATESDLVDGFRGRLPPLKGHLEVASVSDWDADSEG